MAQARSRARSSSSTDATATEVRFDEERGLYELGAEIDGTWIAFATIPATDVTGRAEAIAAHEAAAA